MLGTYNTAPSPMASPARLQQMEVYMDNLNCAAQGSPAQQQQATELILCAIKDIFLSFPGELKDSVSLKKALVGDGSWKVTKEILGWIIDTEKGTIQLPPCRLVELKDLLDIPASLWRMSVKKLRALIGKLRSMHLAVPSAIRHFYHIQAALTKADSGRQAYLSQAFHAKIAY